MAERTTSPGGAGPVRAGAASGRSRRTAVIAVLGAALAAAVALAAIVALTLQSGSGGQGDGPSRPDASPPRGLGPAVDLSTSSRRQFYVSASRGDDEADGSRRRPWRTIRRAAVAAVPGSTVHVSRGSYRGPVTLPRSGSSGHRIRFTSTTRWGARIRAARRRAVAIVDIRGAYVDFEGFDVSGRGGDGTVGILVVGNHSRAIANHVHDLAIGCSGSRGGAGIGFDGGAAHYRSHHQAAIGNFVENVGSGPRDGSCRGVHGIYMAARRGVAVNNVIVRSAGDGITSWHAASALRVSNNTSVGNGGNGITIGSGGGGGVTTGNRGSLVANNITVGNHICGITESSDGRRPRPDDNGYYSNLMFANTKRGNACDTWSDDWTRTITADPLFVDRARNDLRVAPNSPAVSSGTSRPAPPYDYDGIRRPKGPGIDRGAFER